MYSQVRKYTFLFLRDQTDTAEQRGTIELYGPGTELTFSGWSRLPTVSRVYTFSIREAVCSSICSKRMLDMEGRFVFTGCKEQGI